MIRSVATSLVGRRIVSQLPPTNHNTRVCEQSRKRRIGATRYIFTISTVSRSSLKYTRRPIVPRSGRDQSEPRLLLVVPSTIYGLQPDMSTTHLTIHDLLRITYTYEMQAVEMQAGLQEQQQQQQFRPRSDSACSVSLYLQLPLPSCSRHEEPSTISIRRLTQELYRCRKSVRTSHQLAPRCHPQSEVSKS